MTLNRLQRIGIVLSVLWLFGATIYYENETNKLDDQSLRFAYENCADRKDKEWQSKLDACLNAAHKNRNDIDSVESCTSKLDPMPHMSCTNEVAALQSKQTKERHLYVSMFGAALPLPFFWLLGFVVLRVYRWIMKGQP